ncbi:MAG: AI-2E family transporter [Anaerolineales bacterium]|nr:AI-2E family transporter [Anaerolineales bacterium]
MDNSRSHWSISTKIIVSLLLLAFFVFLLFRFSSIIAPVVISILLAYILSPVVNLIQNRLGLHRAIAIILAYILLVLLIIGVLMLIIPPLAEQFSGLSVDIQLFFQYLESILGRRYSIAGQIIDFSSVYKEAMGSLEGLLTPVFGQTLELVSDVITSVVWVIFIAVVTFYLIKDDLVLRDWLENNIPPNYRQDFIILRSEINHIWSGFFRGQLMLALVVAILFSIVGLVLGIPFPLPMAIIAGLLEFLPSVGHGIWLVVASILSLSLGSTWLPLPNWIFMLIVIALHLVYEQFDLNYLIPRIIGRSVHLPPLVVILGIVGGAVLAGVLGIFLAAPTIASARVIGRYIFANLFDMPPFPESVVSALPPPNPNWWRKLFQRKLPTLNPKDRGRS